MANNGAGKLYYVQAGEQMAEPVFRLVQDTVTNVYPKFYRTEIVEHFCKVHSLEEIKKTIREGGVFVLGQGDSLIGTGTVSQNHISRFFVAPVFQGRGFGRFILGRLEREIQRNHPKIQLEVALPARMMFKHCGYTTIRYNRRTLDSGLVLICDAMEKEL